MLGKALFENITIQPQFAHFFLAFMHGRYNFMNLVNDLATLDRELFKNLMFLKTYQVKLINIVTFFFYLYAFVFIVLFFTLIFCLLPYLRFAFFAEISFCSNFSFSLFVFFYFSIFLFFTFSTYSSQFLQSRTDIFSLLLLLLSAVPILSLSFFLFCLLIFLLILFLFFILSSYFFAYLFLLFFLFLIFYFLFFIFYFLIFLFFYLFFIFLFFHLFFPPNFSF